MTTSTDFNIKGIIEGFYGYYYTFPERNDLIKFLGKNDFNYYIYAPKNDRQHRDYWRQPYPERVMDKFAETVSIAIKSGITFNYALSPISMCYSKNDDTEIIKNKLLKFYNIGVRAFSLLVDDIPHRFPHEEDNENFKSSAEAHAFLCNEIYNWLQKLDNSCQLIMCPTDYHGIPPYSDYVKELGEKLHSGINVFYTGPDICSEEIKAETVKKFTEAAKRKPLIWDNYPVNDLAMQPYMHIGPIRGRDKNLGEEVNGLIVNTMIQPEASKISLLTFRDYLSNPKEYNPDKSWKSALKEIGGEGSLSSLEIFGENSMKSCLYGKQAEKLDRLVKKLLSLLMKNQKVSETNEVKELEKYLDEIDAACYYLLNWMDNTKLRNDLLPWIDLLKHKYWMGKRALMVLKKKEDEKDYQRLLKLMQDSREKVQKHNKNIAGTSLELLSDYVQSMEE